MFERCFLSSRLQKLIWCSQEMELTLPGRLAFMGLTFRASTSAFATSHYPGRPSEMLFLFDFNEHPKNMLAE